MVEESVFVAFWNPAFSWRCSTFSAPPSWRYPDLRSKGTNKFGYNHLTTLKQTETIQTNGTTSGKGRIERLLSFSSAGWSCRWSHQWRGWGWRRSRIWWRPQSRCTCRCWLRSRAGLRPETEGQQNNQFRKNTVCLHAQHTDSKSLLKFCYHKLVLSASHRKLQRQPKYGIKCTYLSRIYSCIHNVHPAFECSLSKETHC